MKNLLAALFCLAVITAQGNEKVFPVLKKAPVIDGAVTAGEYEGGFAGELKKMRTKKTPDRTEVYFGRDDKNFYAAFVCYDSSITTLKRMFRTGEEHDNAIWLDDCVEVRFDPWNDPENLAALRHIVINANGISFDSASGNKLIDFSSKIQSRITADRWTVEIAVPLTELTGYDFSGGEMWRIGLMRFNPRSKEMWSLTGDLEQSFNAPAHYLSYRSGKKSELLLEGFRKGELAVKHCNPAGKAMNLELSQQRVDGRIVGAVRRQTLVPGGKARLAITIHQQARMLRLSADGKVILEWDAPKQVVKSSSVRMTEKPLYKELWSDQPTGLVRNGSMTWNHYFSPNFLVTALDFAIPWHLPEAMKTVHKEKLNIIVSGTALSPEWTNVVGISPAGTKFTGMTRYYEHQNIDAPRSRDGYPLLIDPRAKKAFLAGVTLRNKPYEKHLQYIHFGDEVNEHLEEYFIDMLKHQGKYPELDKMVETIKNQYGGGKYGPPESMADPNPYRWIAMRSFLSKELIGLHRDLKELMKKEFPNVKLISDDAGSLQNKLYDYAEMTPEVCDVTTIQLYPLRDPDVSDYSFLCKYLVDLTGIEELHPCFHVENYGETYTPLEVLERISQGVRAGAAGFHWYLADTAGARSGRNLEHEIVGSPERWQIEMALQNEMRRMNKLKFPAADCGFFTPITTLRAYPGGINNRPQKAMMLHSLLELHGKVWFKYFNETSLSKKRVDLSKFKAVFTADSKYCPADAMNTLVEYAKNGGTLVITDPEAFTFNAIGDALDRSVIPGMAKMTGKKACKTMKYGSAVLPLGKMEQFKLVPAENSQILARYANGDAAMIKTPLGKGFVIISGVNFAHIEAVKSKEFQAWFRTFAQSLGLKTDQDIWRFRFPLSLIAPDPKPVAGRCLTDNYIFFQNFRALAGANEKAPAQARYKAVPAPDAPADSADTTFRKGKLTDRRRAYKAGHVDGKNIFIDDRIVGWSKPDGITIEFELGRIAQLDRVELFFHGAARDITLYCKNDKDQWQKVGVYPAEKQEFLKMAVVRKTLRIPTDAPATGAVKLEFAAASDRSVIAPGERLPGYYPLVRQLKKNSFNKANFQISEIEIWSK